MESVIREIQSFWHIQEPEGWEQTEIQAAAEKFGALPKLLCEYYAVLGRNDALNKAYNTMLAPKDLHEAGEYVCICSGNQDTASWCIAKVDLSKDEPPVFVTYDDRAFWKESDSLSEFLRSMSSFHALFAFPYHNERAIILNAWQKDVLEIRLKKLENRKNNETQTAYFQNTPNDLLSVSGMVSQPERGSYLVMYAAWEKSACTLFSDMIEQVQVGGILPNNLS